MNDPTIGRTARLTLRGPAHAVRKFNALKLREGVYHVTSGAWRSATRFVPPGDVAVQTLDGVPLIVAPFAGGGYTACTEAGHRDFHTRTLDFRRPSTVLSGVPANDAGVSP